MGAQALLITGPNTRTPQALPKLACAYVRPGEGEGGGLSGAVLCLC